jgi:hypothetical protein
MTTIDVCVGFCPECGAGHLSMPDEQMQKLKSDLATERARSRRLAKAIHAAADGTSGVRWSDVWWIVSEIDTEAEVASLSHGHSTAQPKGKKT